MESGLENLLSPVKSRPGFTTELRARLQAIPAADLQVMEPPTRAAEMTFYGLAGAVGSILLVLTGFRALIVLLSALEMIGEAGRKEKEVSTVV